MAIDLIMPRMHDTQSQPPFYSPVQMPPAQAHAHPRTYFSTISYANAGGPHAPYTSPYTPQISPLSTSGSTSQESSSPISPVKISTGMTRQIRPLYIPAVLRPTEFPKRASPLQKSDDRSGTSSLDESGLWPSSSVTSLTGLGAIGCLSRRSTGDSGRCLENDWANLDSFPEPTGPPTRTHWKPDASSIYCDHGPCKRSFSYFTRRHHCRKCGDIFCDTHSASEVPLDQNVNFNPRGVPSRACDHCYSQFKTWRSIMCSKDSPSSQEEAPRNRANAAAVPVPGRDVTLAPQRDAALSVPRDWTWSTF